MTNTHQQEQAAAQRGLLRAVSNDLGHQPAPEWLAAFNAVPRHHFLPERIWLDDGDNSYEPCDLKNDTARWYTAAYADVPVVTQVNDGAEPQDGDVWASSSASAPSIVFRMLEDLDAHDGANVLEIGTGTGWSTGLLSHRLGEANVTTLEIDGSVTARARTALHNAGMYPHVVCADGAKGWPSRAPYDRVICTCSVRRVPHTWVQQAQPGAVIVTAWDNPWITYGLLRLDVRDGIGEGRFSPHGAFMLMRGQRSDLRIYRDVVRDAHRPAESQTSLAPWEVAGQDINAQFAIGMRLGDVWYTRQQDPHVDGVMTRLWVATTDATSWAAIDYDGERDDQFTVWQHGPRRLWDEVETAHHWWRDNDSPEPDRFGLTVTASEQRAWLHSPDVPVTP
ncbi:methyltransferase domain-containing protein [Streptomyces sp. H39-S7]|uniref:methyltransferase domain-containing protein n=1 Tax=Streptomyces sp. H39-S7 TaxID=3004357 RepID=UPI0022B017E9|nr:methyltransferase domain-containing protein [Streptomyces sp. H39-S7]MCZ4117805.1 methyltransferase domain-containing protein [Streptomyces sp. H39-S7]